MWRFHSQYQFSSRNKIPRYFDLIGYWGRNILYSIGFISIVSDIYRNYRRYEESTIIKKNLYLDSQQLLNDQRILIHNNNKNNPNQKTIIIIGSGKSYSHYEIRIGISAITQALKLLEKGEKVIHITTSHNTVGDMEFTDPFNLQVFNSKYFYLYLQRLKYKFNWNIYEEKFSLLWGLNYVILTYFRSKEQNYEINLAKQNISELSRLIQIENKETRFFDSKNELDTFQQYLTQLDVPFEVISQPSTDILEISMNFNACLQINKDYVIDNKIQTQIIQKQCQAKFSDSYQVFQNLNIDQFVMNQEEYVIGVNTTEGIILGDFIILCDNHKTKYFTEMLGYRLPIIPMKESVIQMHFPALEQNIYTPKFNCLKDRLIGEYEVMNDLKQFLSDGKDIKYQTQLREQFASVTKMDIDFYDIRSNICPLTPDERPVISKLQRFPNVIINVPLKYPFGAASVVEKIINENEDWSELSLNRFII